MKRINNYLIVANDNYITYAKSLIYSISKYNEEYKIYLYLVNPSEILLDEIKEKQFKYNIELNVIRNELDKIKHPLNKFSQESAYSANIRGQLLLNIVINTEIDNLTYIDADSIINSSIDNLCEYGYDFSFFKRSEKLCSSGILSLNINKFEKAKIIDMLQFYVNKIEKYCLYRWYSDQTALRDVYKEFVELEKIRTSFLTVEYFDFKFRDDSKIWMAKGNKRNIEKYVNMQQLYSSLF